MHDWEAGDDMSDKKRCVEDGYLFQTSACDRSVPRGDSAVFVKPSPVSGLGVFANRPLPKGTVVEQCACLHVPFHSLDPSLRNYTFNDPTAPPDVPDMQLLTYTGNCAAYNHSSDPNVDYRYDSEMERLVMTTNRDVREGEELFDNYGSHWFRNRNMEER